MLGQSRSDEVYEWHLPIRYRSSRAPVASSVVEGAGAFAACCLGGRPRQRAGGALGSSKVPVLLKVVVGVAQDEFHHTRQRAPLRLGDRQYGTIRLVVDIAYQGSM